MEHNNIVDFTDNIVDGDLTSDGVQYSTVVDTTDIDTDVEVINHTTEILRRGELAWLKFNLIAEFQAVSSATADLVWKWQARNKGGTWVDLHEEVTETDIGTTYKSCTRSGYFEPETNFNRVPFDIRLILQCNEATQGRARVKNSSYVRVIYKVV